METVQFSVGKALRRGKLFETGLYPKQKFPYGPDEMKKTIENTKLPVKIVIEHLDTKKIPTVLDGRLGHITQLIPDAAFSQLSGISEWPEWLEEALDGIDKSVSCTFNRETYALESVSLTVDPVVTDAGLNEKLLAAFSKYAEGEGDMEITKEQEDSLFSKLWDKFTAKAKETTPPVEPPKTDPPAVPAVPAETAAQFSALQDEVKKAQEQLARIQDEGYRTEAANWFKTIENRLRPTEGKDLQVVFSEVKELAYVAIRDDAQNGFATFSRDGKDVSVSRFDMLKSAYETLPPVDQNQELIGSALFSEPLTEDQKKQSEAFENRILGLDPVGRIGLKGGTD